MMLTWLGAGPPRLGGVRIVLGARRLRATGSLVSSADGGKPAYSAAYTLSTGENGVISRVSVRAVNASGERQVTLNRSEEGIWLVDHGQGAERTPFDGAVDVDVAACVMFSAIPVRRLGLHRHGGEHELPVVFVGLPDLSVRLVRQTYRSAGGGGPHTVSFQQDDFHADLTVDDDGLVVDYPGLARRV